MSRVKIPGSLDEAIKYFDKKLSKDDKKFLLEEGAAAVHFSLGVWIRNNWGFWKQEENDLKKELEEKGYTHPDDMSNFIIEEYIKHLEKKYECR